MRRSIIILGAIIAAATTGCSTVVDCTPGITQMCTCAGGATGAQTCNAEGNGFSACSCVPGDTDGGGGDTDAGDVTTDAGDVGTDSGPVASDAGGTDAGEDPGPAAMCAMTNGTATATLMEGGGASSASLVYYSGGALRSIDGSACMPDSDRSGQTGDCFDPYICGSCRILIYYSGASRFMIGECAMYDGFYGIS